tara:strand:- start:766 stop:1152 length:387 start_codon:yes stop_codon:yes gene_type:complete
MKTAKIERDEKGRLKKGSAVLNPKGRTVGAKNKVPTEVKDMVLKALALAGADIKKEDTELADIEDSTAYLVKVAKEMPNLFVPMVAKLMPAKVDMEVSMMGNELLQLMTRRRDQLAALKDVTPEEGDE